MTNRPTAAILQVRKPRELAGDAVAEAANAEDEDSEIQFNSAAKSLALCQRSSGSFARHYLTTRSSSDGAIGCSCVIAGGSLVRIAAIKLARALPANAAFPVAIS